MDKFWGQNEVKIFFLDGTTRYGNAHRRAVVRCTCFSVDGLAFAMLVLKETDPTATCPRRHKGQSSCPELTCFQCDNGFVNLVSTSGSVTVGAIAHKFLQHLKLHDRQVVLSRLHGIVEPEDVDWEEMGSTPTG